MVSLSFWQTFGLIAWLAFWGIPAGWFAAWTESRHLLGRRKRMLSHEIDNYTLSYLLVLAKGLLSYVVLVGAEFIGEGIYYGDKLPNWHVMMHYPSLPVPWVLVATAIGLAATVATGWFLAKHLARKHGFRFAGSK